MTAVLSDCRHAFRLYARTPVATAIAVVALAVALAFVSAFLSLYVGLVLRPPAGFEQGDRLVTLGQTEGETLRGLPYALIERIADEMSSLDAVAGSTAMPPGVDEAGENVALDVVTRGFFDGLGPRLQRGRGFEASDHTPESALVAVISDRYWREALAGADVLGTTLRLELQPYEIRFGETDEEEPEPPDFRIVGIMAPEASGLVPNADVWLPFERVRPFFIRGPSDQIAGMVMRSTFATLALKAEGASTSSVIAELESRYANADELHAVQAGLRFEAVDGIVTDLKIMRDSKRQLLLFLAASVLLVLVAAANVSLFLLARAPGRRRELGIRLSVGAPMRRLVRQLASEAGVLVIVSSVLGLLVASLGTSLLGSLSFLREARWQDVSLIDWHVLLGLAAFMLILTGLVSLAPVLGLKRLSIAASSRQVRARATLTQHIAGTSQIAIAATLVGVAIAFGWHLILLTFVDPGFEVQDRYMVEFDFDLSRVRSNDDAGRLIAAQNLEMQRIRERVGAIPGVARIGLGYPVPGSSDYNLTTSVPHPDGSGQNVTVRSGAIDLGYVDVLGLELRHGRAPAAGDDIVVLVNRLLAQALFGRDDVVGETIQRSAYFNDSHSRIVGVLEDVAYGHPSAGVEPLMLLAVDNRNVPSVAIIETTMSAARLRQELEAMVDAGALEIDVGDVESLAVMRSHLIAPDRARGLLTIGAATLVVVLATLGFYGTQRYIVGAGRREYAIRASLGAGPIALERLVLRRALMLGLPGLVVGGLLAFIAVGWLRGDYVSREISTATVVVALTVGLGLVLLAASLGPAREARRTEPTLLLRVD